MALKDISTNLENYKFGMSDPQKIDTQRAAGVDFFDNEEGGVIKGFTTNVVPGEHQTEYRNYYEGTPVGPRSHSGTFFANLLPVQAQSMFRKQSGVYVFSRGGTRLPTSPPFENIYPPFDIQTQLTLNLENGFSGEPYIPDAQKSFDSISLLDKLTFDTSFISGVQSLTNLARAPHLIVQPATENSTQAFNWDYNNQPSQLFAQTLDGGSHKSYFSNLKGNSGGSITTEFINVPVGLNQNNLFGAGTHRQVSNTGPDTGKLLHPIILRPLPIGNTETRFADINSTETVENIFGVPELNNTYLGVSHADSIRLQTLYDNDIENGGLILDKQTQLQKYNTFINTRVLQPLSIIGKNDGVENAFLKPQRHKEVDQIVLQTQTTVNTFSDVEDMETTFPGFFTPDFSDSNSTQIINDETIIPIGTGQNGLARLFKPSSIPIYGPFSVSTMNFTQNLIGAYPNRYKPTSAPGEVKSSAPVSIENGVPSFVGNTRELATRDSNKILGKKGGNFNKESNISNASNVIEKYATLAYGNLASKNFRYEKDLLSSSEILERRGDFVPNKLDPVSATSVATTVVDAVFGAVGVETNFNPRVRTNDLVSKRDDDKFYKTDRIGKQGSTQRFLEKNDSILGLIKGNNDGLGGLGDEINLLPAVDAYKVSGEDIESSSGTIRDYIKFRFFDVNDRKYIVMRAILSGIQDNVTPEYSEEKYMGRPDKLYVYKGADRDISFNFKIYPKSKQELPVLMHKLEYLVGLCYPSFTRQNRMKSPFIELTIGDMYVDEPGILKSVNVTVEDNTTWETQDGLQFPKHINVACQFRYIGKHNPSTRARHYNGFRPDRLANPTQTENFNNTLTTYFGNGPVVRGIVNLNNALSEDPENLVEDALDATFDAIGGLFR